MKNKNFCKKLNAMIKEEHNAPKEYNSLIKSAPKRVKKIIGTITPQEREHYSKLKKIKLKEC